MAKRSAAQKRATARLVAMNRARARGTRPKSSSRGRSFGIRASKRGTTHTVHLAPVAGGAAAVYGLAASPVGGDTPISCIQQKRWTDLKSQLKQRLYPNFIQKNTASGVATAQWEIFGGAAFAARGRQAIRWALRQVGVHKTSIHTSKRHAIGL